MQTEMEDWSSSKITAPDYWGLRETDTDWGPPGAQEVDGIIRTPHGIAHVSTGWMRQRSGRFEQSIMASFVYRGRLYWGRMNRPASRALKARGCGMKVSAWIERIVREEA